MNLYKITLKNYKSYYVVAENETSAYKKLRKIFDDEDLCFASERILKCIELIGTRFYEENVFNDND